MSSNDYDVSKVSQPLNNNVHHHPYNYPSTSYQAPYLIPSSGIAPPQPPLPAHPSIHHHKPPPLPPGPAYPNSNSNMHTSSTNRYPPANNFYQQPHPPSNNYSQPQQHKGNNSRSSTNNSNNFSY